ncbi:hypothetical protein D1BOALGB6SA_4015 [Olavius sp. associated proteobacterium Delta 1]|nr:hypothetical protein D1BOALGB6SA_4015 [Olavius sp. associated proteobacterium Delta 1]
MNFSNDLTEGGHLETDSGAFSFAEWWYLNGKLELEAEDGEKRSVGWFSTMGHQESPSITDGNIQLSHLFKFSALYNEDGTNHIVYNDTYIPRSAVSNFIGIHKAYLLFHYPNTPSVFFGSAATSYTVNDQLEIIEFSMFFKPQVNKTLEQARTPLKFTTYEYANGKIGGSITIGGKQFFVKRGNAYFDHMIPTADIPWPMKMNGWSWAEVTTPRYQAVIYAVRSLDDGFEAYTYKHLTLLDRKTGEVVTEFHDEQVEIIEGDWKEETTYGVSRPQSVTYKAGKFEVSVFADNTATLDRNLPGLNGFVNFMAFQKKGATIKRNDRTFSGSAFYEYLVSDKARAQNSNGDPARGPSW